MAIEIATIRSTTPGSTGNQSYTSSGFGTPDAALIFGFKSTSDDTTTDHDITCYGGTDGTRQWTVHGKAVDNLATTYCYDGCSNSDCFRMMSTGSNTNIDIEGNFNAWVTDGIQINFTTAAYQAGIIIVLIKADNVYADTVSIASAGSTNITAPGFEPNYVFCTYQAYNGTTGTGANWRNQFGMCANDGDTVTQAGLRQVHDNNSASGSVQGSIGTTSVLGSVYAAGSAHITLSDFDSDGFTLNVATGIVNSYMRYLAIGDADNGEGKVAAIQAPNSTGDEAYTGFPNKPKYLFLVTSEYDNLNTQDSDDTRNVMGISVVDGVNNSFFTTFDDDGAATTDTACRSGAGIKSFDQTDKTGYDHVATLSSFDSEGFTLNYTTAGRTSYWIAMTIGPAPEEAADVYINTVII